MTKSDGKTVAKAILRLVVHILSKTSRRGGGLTLMQRSRLQVLVPMLQFTRMLFSHKYSLKLCICMLFNNMFQNSNHEQLETDTEICRLWYSKENV
jgi:hypothetical protein